MRSMVLAFAELFGLSSPHYWRFGEREWGAAHQSVLGRGRSWRLGVKFALTYLLYSLGAGDSVDQLTGLFPAAGATRLARQQWGGLGWSDTISKNGLRGPQGSGSVIPAKDNRRACPEPDRFLGRRRSVVFSSREL